MSHLYICYHFTFIMDPIVEIVKICRMKDIPIKHAQLHNFISCLSHTTIQQLYDGSFELACRINPNELINIASKLRNIFGLQSWDDHMIWFLETASRIKPHEKFPAKLILRMKKYLLSINDEKYCPKLSYLYSHCITFIPDTNAEAQEEFLTIYNYIFEECIEKRRIEPVTNSKNLSEFITEFAFIDYFAFGSMFDLPCRTIYRVGIASFLQQDNSLYNHYCDLIPNNSHQKENYRLINDFFFKNI